MNDFRQASCARALSGRGARELKDWLFREAELAVSNEDIARRFVAECRRTSTVLPATSTIERLCATALVDAERQIEARIADRLSMSNRESCYRPICWPMSRRWDGSTSISPDKTVGQSLSVGFRPLPQATPSFLCITLELKLKLMLYI